MIHASEQDSALDSVSQLLSKRPTWTQAHQQPQTSDPVRRPGPRRPSGADPLKILSLENDRALRRFLQAEKQSSRSGLPTAALTCEAQDLSLPNMEADAVNGLHGLFHPRKNGGEESFF